MPDVARMPTLMDLFDKYGQDGCVDKYLNGELLEDEQRLCHGALSPNRVLARSNVLLIKAIKELREELHAAIRV
jgi:hypothetical protein